MSGKQAAPIIVVKRKKGGHGGHHGGSWKVAYADFVTAMMAFFMVLWLITALDKEQRAALFDYFKNPSLEQGKSTKAAPAQMGPGGASTSVINLHGGLDSPRTAMAKQVTLVDTAKVPGQDQKQAMEQQSDAAADAADHKKLESLMEELRAAIEKSQALAPYKDQLLLDITPEGLRIQIVDEQNRSMFDVGSARLKDYTTNILHQLASYLGSVPNRIAISGHTDVRPYPGNGTYTNWELSADRANAARRALEEGGLPVGKVARVVGLSSTVLFDKDDPESPTNRRISIIVMTKAVEDSQRQRDEAPEHSVPGSPAPATTATAAPSATTTAGVVSPGASGAPVTAVPTPAVSAAAAPAHASQTALAVPSPKP